MSKHYFEDKIMTTCPLCGMEYQYGPHVYSDTKLKGYDLFVCDTCYRNNQGACGRSAQNDESEPTCLTQVW